MNKEFWRILLKRRRTIRLFTQQPVARDCLEALMEAARQSSCAANLQRLRYTVVTNSEAVAAILPHTAWAGLVKPRRTPKPGITAPTAWIAVHADSSLADNPILHADAGAAIQSMELAASVHGLGCCWIASVNKSEVSKIIHLPPTQQLLYIVAIGHPAESPISEDSTTSTAYYLDDNNRLHVPKLTTDSLVQWLP